MVRVHEPRPARRWCYFGQARMGVLDAFRSTIRAIAAWPVAAAILAGGIALSGLVAKTSAASAQSVYTVAKYPVGAVASDAVKAERIALRDGQARAFRSLLKRLTPVTDLMALPKLTPAQIAGAIGDYTINNVENSGTEYLANIDYRFNESAVRRLARKAQIRIVDQQAEPTVLLAVFDPGADGADRSLARGTIDTGGIAADGAADGAAGGTSAGTAWTVEATSGPPPSPFEGKNSAAVQRAWGRAWVQLDLTNALTPLRLRARRTSLQPGLVQAVRSGDPRAAQALARAYKTTSIVVATVTPSKRAGFMRFSLSGLDRRGPVMLSRDLPMLDNDLPLSLEAAAVIGLGVLEGRWKALKAPPRLTAAAAGPPEPVVFSVQFSSLREWRNISDFVRGLPGASDIEQTRARARERELQLMLPGGEAALRDALARYGYTLTREGPALIARRS